MLNNQNRPLRGRFWLLDEGAFDAILEASLIPREGFFVRASFSIMSLIQYLKDTRSELRHVSWPSQKQAVVYTVLVIVISILTSLYLGFFDFLFTTLLERFVI